MSLSQSRLVLILFSSVMFCGCTDSQSDSTQNTEQRTPAAEEAVSANQQLEEPPLYKAAERNDVEQIKQLLADGADIDQAAGRDMETALHRAITRRSTETAEILIEAGADINKPRRDGQTPLEMARVRNRTEILAFFKQTPTE